MSDGPTYESNSGPNAELDALLAPPPPKPSIGRLFFGDDGLRAGWSVLLYILLVILVGTSLTFLARHFHLLPNAPDAGQQEVLTPRSATIDKLMEISLFVLPAVLIAFIERRPFARYGLATRRALPDLCAGLFWGFAAISFLIGALYLTHSIALEGFVLRGVPAFLFAAKWAFAFFLVGLSEEFLFRGFLLYTVARGVAGIVREMSPGNRHSHLIGFLVAATLFSEGLFMLAHLGNGGENLLGIFQVGLAGAVFAFALYRTGSLWWAIGMHTAWDWAQSYFYGTPDSGNLVVGHLLNSHPIGSRLLSGGPDGPEGSLLGVPALLLVALVIHLTLPKRDYPLTPDQT